MKHLAVAILLSFQSNFLQIHKSRLIILQDWFDQWIRHKQLNLAMKYNVEMFTVVTSFKQHFVFVVLSEFDTVDKFCHFLLRDF